jgi:hypothetical protein
LEESCAIVGAGQQHAPTISLCKKILIFEILRFLIKLKWGIEFAIFDEKYQYEAFTQIIYNFILTY